MLLSVEIERIEPFADGAAFGEAGAYERVIGKARGEIDPGHPGNRGIALIDRAPLNARGRVEYTTDIFILRPRDFSRGNGRILYDVRDPGTDYPVGTGVRRPGKRLLTVGTDCAVGKMFTALTIERALRGRGVEASFRASGQTGILIAGGGIPIDAIVSDFVSGAAEALSPSAPSDHWDVIEGQGSLFHPAFAAVSLGLLHGSQPDAMVLCHAAGRTEMVGTGGHQVPELSACIEAHEAAARVVHPGARVTGISLNTSEFAEDEAREIIRTTAEEHDLPVGDPVRTGLDAIVASTLAQTRVDSA